MRKIISAIIVLIIYQLTALYTFANDKLQLLDSLSHNQINIDSTIKYANQELDLAIKQEKLPERANAQFLLAKSYYAKNNLDKATEMAKFALDVYNLLNDTLKQAQCYSLLGNTMAKKGASGTADGLLNRSLELYKSIDNKPAEASVYRDMGLLCLRYKVYDRAYEYFSRALEINQKFENQDDIAKDMYCLGYGQMLQCIDENGSLTQLNRAKSDLLKALNCKNTIHLIDVYCALTDAYLQQIKMTQGNVMRSSMDSCRFYIELGYQAINLIGASGQTSRFDLRKARYILATNDFVTSNHMLQKLQTDVETDYENNIELTEDVYKALAELHETTGNYRQAFAYLKKINDANMRKNSDGYLINSTQTKIQTEYDEELRQYEQSEREKELIFEAETNRFRTTLTFVITILVFVMLYSIVIYRNNKRRKKNNELLNEQNQKLENQQSEIIKQNELLSQKNEEIEKQRDEIEGQRNYLSSQNKLMLNANRQITDSILYAKRIQEAAVPSEKMMQSIFGDCLIFWRPLNIVSGDFYWATQIGNHKLIAVADCTGHGVPGAFMSMLGISLLNDIVSSINLAEATASQVLNQLRTKLKSSLRQTGKVGEADDGIDLAFCIFDTESKRMQYAGAFRPLIIIRNGELIEYKADKMPCGVYINETESFTNNEIETQSGDVLYMYSDGIADQFSGGRDMRKFTIRRLKEMLIEQHSKPFEQQKLLIAKTIDDWRKPKSGFGKQSDQVDDILLVGLRIS